MGFDIAIITKEKIIDSDGELTDRHYLLDRGFCSIIMNAKYASSGIFEELGNILQIDLSFLLKPEYNNPHKYSDEELREMGLDEDYIQQSKTEEPSGFVDIEAFLIDLKKLLKSIELTPDYETKMTYDREWWLNYFSTDFQNDLKSISDFLTELTQKGHKEFSFDI